MTQQNESQQKITSRIKQALTRTDNSFALFFALVNLPETRQLITSNLIQQLNRPVCEITVNAAELEGTTLDAWLLPQLETAPKESIIFLYNYNEVLPTEKKSLRNTLQQLNWRRSSLAAMQRPLVIWLPLYAIEELAEYAPDFYDWYSNVYEFSSSEDKEKIEKLFRSEFESTEVHPAERMKSQDKQKWLRTLSVLLTENKERNKYRAKLLSDLGRLHKAIGNLENALENYNEALDIQREIDDKSGEGTTLNNISQIHHDRGDYETALKYLEQSLAIRQQIGDKSGEGSTLNNISQIYDARGDYETALKYLEQSLAIQQEIGDKSGEGITLNNISQIFKARGDNETALKYLEQSLAIQQKIGDKSGEGTTLNNISQILHDRGDYETALKYLEQSLAIQQEIGDKSGEGTTLNNMATTAHARGDNETALKYLEQSLAIRQEIGDVAGLCTTLFNMGHIHMQNEAMDKALSAWINVYQLAKPMQLAQVLDALAGLAPQLGMPEGLEGWEALAKQHKLPV